MHVVIVGVGELKDRIFNAARLFVKINNLFYFSHF